MHWGTSSKIKRSENIEPTGGVPCPTGKWIVNDGGPDEDKHNAREQTTTLRSGSDGERGCDGSEHALVDGIDDVGETGSSGRRLSENMSEADHFQVTDVLARTMRECEGVSPEEPLEGYDGDGHERKPDKGERRLPTGETRVEEADTGNHEPDKGSGGKDLEQSIN